MNTAIEVISGDIGVVRYELEPDHSLAIRTLYSASRFWAEAMCVDDGHGGRTGISKQALNRRLNRWATDAESVCSGLSEWFRHGRNGIPRLYNRLIDIDDLVESRQTGYVSAHRPFVYDTHMGAQLLIGVHDFGGSQDLLPSEVHPDRLISSGLCTILPSEISRDKTETDGLPWLADARYFIWEDADDYGCLDFANPRSTRWTISNSDVWTEDPVWHSNGYTLARRPLHGKRPSEFFLCKSRSGKIRIARIERFLAQEFFFALREDYGNQVIASFSHLDARHIRLSAPIGFLPGEYNRLVDAVTWPVKNIDDTMNRVARIETLELIDRALLASHVVLKELSE